MKMSLLGWIRYKKIQLDEAIERFVIIYSPPRELFTVVVPVVLALLLVLGAFLAGYPLKGVEKTQTVESDKMKAYNELMAQMNGVEGGASDANGTQQADT